MKKIILIITLCLYCFIQNVSADSRPVGYNPDLKYDPDYIVNYNLTSLSGYKINIEKSGNPLVMFYDKKKTHWAIAAFNYERQFWFWHMDHFNPDEIDLKRIYSKINLSKTVLNRDKPDILDYEGYVNREIKPYDYSKDSLFSDFITYMRNGNVPDEQINRYIHAANNPAKRGAGLPTNFGGMYTESEVGIQWLSVQPNNNYFSGLSGSSKLTGGMELLLQTHDFHNISSTRGASYNFRRYLYEKKPVKLVVVEIYPLDGDHSGTLRGRDLLEDIEKAHEKKFRTDFDVSYKKITLDYKRFIGKPGVPYGSTGFKMDALYNEYIHEPYGTENLYMYYFTDSEEYSSIDKSPSHPSLYGAYLTGWDKYQKTYFHELGHSLSLRHHFPDREDSAKEEAHISFPCIMNYYSPWKSFEFCPLCSYSLGIQAMPVSAETQTLLTELSDINSTELTERKITGSTGEITLYNYYSGGRKSLGGTINLGSINVKDMKWYGDNIVLLYKAETGDNYLGLFNEKLEFLKEYNFKALSLKTFNIFEDKIYFIYTDGDSKEALGAFDLDFNYLGEIIF